VTNEGRLAGRRALVTGAGGGIGLATTKRFVAEGAHVIGVDLVTPSDAGDAERITWMEGDVSDPAFMRTAAAAGGGLDICVANAGVGGVESFMDGGLESWERTLRINLIGVMVTLQAAAVPMIAGGAGGRLMATGSIAGLRGESLASAYVASKGGVMALTRALAVELAPHRITVNAVAPGQIDTDLNRNDMEVVSGKQAEELDEFRAEFLAGQVPAGRMGSPDEVAGVFAFLASDEAEFITGSTFRIDGGELAI
jgi:NAD(P)-dependent dehydrogenase (short-subunit alcohol dehydrogenase family)